MMKDEIRERLDKSTPGQWKLAWPNTEYMQPYLLAVQEGGAEVRISETIRWREDATFIVYAPTDIRYLLAENDELLFTIKDKAEFIEFLQAEAVDHREIIAGLEQRVKELEAHEWILVKACLDCSEDMQEVRPGKWQCNNPECPTNQEADNDRA